jgi:hypothetical protein
LAGKQCVFYYSILLNNINPAMATITITLVLAIKSLRMTKIFEEKI